MIKDEIISVAKPILFNTEMVRAILDGRKTQTRRIVVRDIVKAHKWLTARGHWNGGQDIPEDVLEIYVREVAPQYRVGDCLYVRETWTTYYQGGKKHYIYRAGDFNKKVLEEVGNAKLSWLPSIHMPKEAARIFLRVTDISVERLQDIDDDGVVSEGLEIGAPFDELWDSTIKKSERDKYGWDTNPWVFVYKFERMSPE